MWNLGPGPLNLPLFPERSPPSGDKRVPQAAGGCGVSRPEGEGQLFEGGSVLAAIAASCQRHVWGAALSSRELWVCATPYRTRYVGGPRPGGGGQGC